MAMLQRILSPLSPLCRRHFNNFNSFTSQIRGFHSKAQLLPRPRIATPLLATGVALFMPVSMNLQENKQEESSDKIAQNQSGPAL